MERRSTGSQDAVRRYNLSRLLRLVHVHGSTSRAELTVLTGLNRSTVKALTADLVAAGLLRESAPVGHGGAGRPSIQVEPESERLFVLALDIGVAHLRAVRVGLGGTVLDRRELHQAHGDFDVWRTLRRVQRLARDLLDGAPDDAVCVGIGVGVCGVVSAGEGLVRFAPNLGWLDVPLGRLLAAKLGTSLRVSIGNDGDLGAMAEHLRGAAVGLSDVVYISGEVGIGGGIILGGQPMTGSGGFGGEIGHMSVNPQGRTCRCGRRGCWETEIGDEAVLLTTGAAPGAELADVLTAYAAGDRWAQAGMRRVGRWLGFGVVNLVNVLNPQAVVFGGVSRLLFEATEPMVRAALDSALAGPRDQVQLRSALLGDDSIAVGAAELAFAPLLEDPLGLLARPGLALRAPA